MKLTPKTAQALTNLRGNRDFEAFMEGVKEYELDRQQACTDGDGTPLYRAQGAVKALQSLRKAFDDAPVTLVKFKAPNNQQQVK